jgi:hypothetical protein
MRASPQILFFAYVIDHGEPIAQFFARTATAMPIRTSESLPPSVASSSTMQLTTRDTEIIRSIWQLTLPFLCLVFLLIAGAVVDVIDWLR